MKHLLRLLAALAAIFLIAGTPATAQARPTLDSEVIPIAPVVYDVAPDGYVRIDTPMDCLDICVEPPTGPADCVVQTAPNGRDICIVPDEYGNATPPWVDDSDNHDGQPGYTDS